MGHFETANKCFQTISKVNHVSDFPLGLPWSLHISLSLIIFFRLLYVALKRCRVKTVYLLIL